MKNKPIKNGWTIDLYYSCELAFCHILLAKAEEKLEKREAIWIVETINSTIAESEKKESVHHNRYFFRSLMDAIAGGAKVEMAAEVAEDVVDIRRATASEIKDHQKAVDIIGGIDEVAPPEISEEDLKKKPGPKGLNSG